MDLAVRGSDLDLNLDFGVQSHWRRVRPKFGLGLALLCLRSQKVSVSDWHLVPRAAKCLHTVGPAQGHMSA